MRRTRARILYGTAFATAAILVASVAAAQTSGTSSTTTTTTVTTTTIPTPPKKSTGGLSPATSACIKQAMVTKKTCKFSAATAACTAEYDTAFANCFAAGKGVTCATGCLTAKTTCETPALAAEKTALGSCTLSIPNCATNAVATFLSCKKACASSAALLACKNTFTGCLAQCPNL